MRIYFVLLLFCISLPLLAQHVPLIENGEKAKPRNVDSFLGNLYTSNDYVISCRLRLTDQPDERSDYFILTRKNTDLVAYNYLDKIRQLKTIDLSKHSLELIWDTFVQNELFSMRNEKDIPDFCLSKYQIYNSHTYEFVIFSKGLLKRLSYYDPEYYDDVCYGMPERRKIINSASVINYILNQ